MGHTQIPEVQQHIVKCYEAGLTTVELAEELGCCPTTIWKVLKNNNVHTRNRGRRSKFFLDKHGL